MASRFKTRTRERGAVLVESAIVSMFLLLLAAGTIEYASLFASTIDTSNSVRSAARVGATTLTDGSTTTDWDIVQALLAESGGQNTDIQQLVIYEAANGQSKPPAACTGTNLNAGTNHCNIYSAANLLLNQSAFNALPASQKGFTQADRATGEPWLGIWVRMSRPQLFGNFIPAPSQFTDQFTMKVTPKTQTADNSDWGSSAAPTNWQPVNCSPSGYQWANGSCSQNGASSGTGGGSGGSG